MARRVWRRPAASFRRPPDGARRQASARRASRTSRARAIAQAPASRSIGRQRRTATRRVPRHRERQATSTRATGADGGAAAAPPPADREFRWPSPRLRARWRFWDSDGVIADGGADHLGEREAAAARAAWLSSRLAGLPGSCAAHLGDLVERAQRPDRAAAEDAAGRAVGAGRHAPNPARCRRGTARQDSAARHFGRADAGHAARRAGRRKPSATGARCDPRRSARRGARRSGCQQEGNW